MILLTFRTGTYFQSNENEYTQATQGLAWVTFDSTSSTKGTATPRIFVGAFQVDS
jgi:xyloglucan-specific exo-beta-1,4-glucanase